MGHKEKWDYDLLDHKWNNLKRWVELCEQRFGKDGLIPVGRMGDMLRFLDKIEYEIDSAVLDAFERKER
jgi:hypothetical protein